MDENKIREYISLIEQDEQDLRNQLEQLKAIKNRHLFTLSTLGSNHSSNHFVSVPTALPASTSIIVPKDTVLDGLYSDFPKDKSPDEQVLYIIGKIGRIKRLPDIQKEYNLATGSEEINIENTLRKLKAKGLLVAVRFNKSWTSIFYGFPEWVIEDEQGNKTFKEEHRPTKKDLPFGYDTIDFNYNNKG